MTPERWRRITAIFHAALERDAAARAQLLDEAAAEDPALASEVRSLLAAHETGGGFLELPVWAAAPGLLLDSEPGLLPGTCAGPYRIVREVGRGGMGIVYEAEDTRLGRHVALKSLPAQYIRDPARRERLTREARAAAALSHPAIATIYALEEIDGALYLVSELVQGETLREEIRRGPLPPGRLLRTLDDLAAALAAAHAASIVHRDLKPENVMRCADGSLKVLDFGLARLPQREDVTRSRLTQAGTALGTPGYMAPEQLRGEEVDARSDIFAFGVVGWELATGTHPFGASAAELLARMIEVMEGGPSLPSGSPLPVPGLEPVLRKCLRPDPQDRYQSGGELAADIADLARRAALPRVAPSVSSFGWWQVHQGALAAVVATMPVAIWLARHADTGVGPRLFVLVLALSTVAVSIRLNLLFTARVHRAQLAAQRARVRLPLAAVETLLGLILLGSGAAVAGAHDALAAVLVTLAAATLVSLAIIEPATTAAALHADARR